jgi:hypothetical protein
MFMKLIYECEQLAVRVGSGSRQEGYSDHTPFETVYDLYDSALAFALASLYASTFSFFDCEADSPFCIRFFRVK